MNEWSIGHLPLCPDPECHGQIFTTLRRKQMKFVSPLPYYYPPVHGSPPHVAQPNLTGGSGVTEDNECSVLLKGSV
jgi:hypothetical protein